MKEHYTIRQAPTPIPVEAGWDDPARQAAETLTVGSFWTPASDHRPKTQFRLQWDDTALHGIFRVEDQYLRTVQTELNGSVCKDSCVEFFVEPAGGVGYCNFEFNCCGVPLMCHVIDPTRTPGGFVKYRMWTAEEAAQVSVAAPLGKGPIPEERVGPCVWTLAFRLPFAPLLACTGAAHPQSGTVWRANVYKCGDHTSHPHWGSWQPVDTLNFHLPRCFGELRFG